MYTDAVERNTAMCFSDESVKGARVKHCPFCDRCVYHMDQHWCVCARARCWGGVCTSRVHCASASGFLVF
jgi:hypothetical protein